MRLQLLAIALLFPVTAFGQEVGINRPGSDYRNFNANNSQTCENACIHDNYSRYQCKAWTYVRAGVQGPTGRCWLKDAMPRKVLDRNCVSGTREQPMTL